MFDSGRFPLIIFRVESRILILENAGFKVFSEGERDKYSSQKVFLRDTN